MTYLAAPTTVSKCCVVLVGRLFRNFGVLQQKIICIHMSGAQKEFEEKSVTIWIITLFLGFVDYSCDRCVMGLRTSAVIHV